MNAERLLAHFERISEAPDAIARLRRFILDLAVRGKLVEQDPEDEPAAELLAAISSETQHAKGRRKVSPHSAGLVREGPFGVPSSWAWTQLGAIGDWGSGSTPSRGRSDYYGGAISWFKSGELSDNKCLRESEEKITHLALEQCSFRLSNPGDVLIAMYGATIGKLAILGEEAVTNQAVCACTPYWGIDTEYLYLFLLAQRDEFRLASEGGAQPNISKVKIVNTPIPLPPLAEQHRIVAKVDELMALCDQLEAARQQREQGRERLMAATLQRLNQPAEDPTSFRNDASFALQVLPSLTTTPAQNKQLRQTILNLAVRGKLVEQSPEDEPAISWLLQRVEGNHSRRSRKTVATSVEGCQDSSISVLPETWLWVVLDDLVLVMDSGWSPQCEDHPRSSIESWGVLKTTAVQSLFFDERYHKELPSNLQPRPQHEAREGDILITRAGPKNRVGISCVIDKIEPRLMISDKIIRLRLADGLSPCFVALALNAGRSSEAVEDAKSGMAVMQMNISQVKLRAVPIPLPPLAEQHRIVAKVDELIDLCDQLEQQLSQADQQRRRLLEALLAEALGGRLPTAQEESHAVIA